MLSPIALLLYKYQCIVACTENIQSIVGFVVILPKSGVIHWPTHPYTIPCFTGQIVKGSSWDAAQFSFGNLTTDLALCSWQSWAAHGRFWSISGCVYLLLECGDRKRQISLFPWRRSAHVNEAFSHPSERVFSSCVHKMLVCDCGSSETEERSTLLPPLSELRREGAVCTNFGACLFACFLSEVHFCLFPKESTKTWRIR